MDDDALIVISPLVFGSFCFTFEKNAMSNFADEPLPAATKDEPEPEPASAVDIVGVVRQGKDTSITTANWDYCLSMGVTNHK